MIIIIYVKTLKAAGKFAMIQNYIEMVEVYKSVQSILEIACTCKYIPDDSNKTTQIYQKLQLLYKLKNISYIIIVALNLLYNNFEPITANILECRDKTIKEIYQILVLTKIKLIKKYKTDVMRNLGMTTYRKDSKQAKKNECTLINITNVTSLATLK